MLIVAPGKLVLVGEYAVLDGGGAVVAAVDRGVACEVGPGDGIETPGDDRFVRAALAGAPRAHYRFFDHNPVDLPEKPGFGGSAAATVAAVVAAGRPATEAFALHAAVQGGGSGVDVFAAIHGGVRRFPGGEALACPPMVAVWSGRSAATGPRVSRYLAWSGRERFVAESRSLVEAFASAPILATAEARRLLVAMAADAGLDYDLPVFARLSELAAARRGAAKPSGAGGGDVAVALFPDPDARADFVAACEREGLRTIPVSVAGPAGPR